MLCATFPSLACRLQSGSLEVWDGLTMLRLASWQAHSQAVLGVGQVPGTGTKPDPLFVWTHGREGEITLWQVDEGFKPLGQGTPIGSPLASVFAGACAFSLLQQKLVAAPHSTSPDVCAVWDLALPASEPLQLQEPAGPAMLRSQSAASPPAVEALPAGLTMGMDVVQFDSSGAVILSVHESGLLAAHWVQAGPNVGQPANKSAHAHQLLPNGALSGAAAAWGEPITQAAFLAQFDAPQASPIGHAAGGLDFSKQAVPATRELKASSLSRALASATGVTEYSRLPAPRLADLAATPPASVLALAGGGMCVAGTATCDAGAADGLAVVGGSHRELALVSVSLSKAASTRSQLQAPPVVRLSLESHTQLPAAGVGAVAWSQGGCQLAAGCWDTSLRIFRVCSSDSGGAHSLQPVQVIHCSAGRCRGLTWLPSVIAGSFPSTAPSASTSSTALVAVKHDIAASQAGRRTSGRLRSLWQAAQLPPAVDPPGPGACSEELCTAAVAPEDSVQTASMSLSGIVAWFDSGKVAVLARHGQVAT